MDVRRRRRACACTASRRCRRSTPGLAGATLSACGTWMSSTSQPDATLASAAVVMSSTIFSSTAACLNSSRQVRRKCWGVPGTRCGCTWIGMTATRSSGRGELLHENPLRRSGSLYTSLSNTTCEGVFPAARRIDGVAMAGPRISARPGLPRRERVGAASAYPSA